MRLSTQVLLLYHPLCVYRPHEPGYRCACRRQKCDVQRHERADPVLARQVHWRMLQRIKSWRSWTSRSGGSVFFDFFPWSCSHCLKQCQQKIGFNLHAEVIEFTCSCCQEKLKNQMPRSPGSQEEERCISASQCSHSQLRNMAREPFSSVPGAVLDSRLSGCSRQSWC